MSATTRDNVSSVARLLGDAPALAVARFVRVTRRRPDVCDLIQRRARRGR